MDMRLNQNLYNETSSDEYSSDSSEDDDEEVTVKNKSPYKSPLKAAAIDEEAGSEEKQNVMLKLINREHTGYFNGCWTGKSDQRAFNKVPSRLSFCLKDIVPYCYLQGHMFMGLTVCGQFLVSYKVCYDESSLASDYNFSTYYKYTLYFWIYRPHHPLGKYYKVCLFDDHGVDNLKTVTMTQWITNPRTLVVHGASEYENEDSYITIVRVPKLGCLECKELKDFDASGFKRCDALCIKCNLTIHTKYSTTESDPSFNPHINLICPERIVVIANGFIHMLYVDLEVQKQQQSPQHQQHNHQSKQNLHSFDTTHLQRSDKTVPDFSQDDGKIVFPSSTEIGCDNKNNIVARIIADFSDCENEVQTLNDKSSRWTENKNVNYNELIFTCGLSTLSSTNSSNNISKASSNVRSQTKVSLLNHQGRKNHKIVTKSYRNGVTTVDLQASSTSGMASDKSNAYEFSEDNENCEKIGTFRKRRLADKKYEFSEDNLENIIPFTKVRLTTQARPSPIHRALTSSHHHSTHSGTVYLSPSSQSFETTSHLHRASPSQGFRSPCGSPVGSSRILRSPPSRSIQQPSSYQKSPPRSNTNNSSQQSQQMASKPLNTLSPRQVTVTKRSPYERDNFSPTSPFLSPRRDEAITFISADGSEKPTCTKKFKRRYVEEDDAASVITSEEDDCISPGYHTSLPMEVHGSCYSDMQMISQISYQKLKCPTVIITQHSFDLETFTYHVISNLCQTNNKTYDVFYDWACELVQVCPISSSISCILMAHFTARDQLPNNSKKCVNCSRSIDCVFHRKQFECRIFFIWNMETGVWDVLDYGQLLEVPSVSKTNCGLTKVAKALANELSGDLKLLHNFEQNLNVLDSNMEKSKDSLIDVNNSIEFYRKRTKLTAHCSHLNV